jgi:hypothetical protein
MYKKMSKIGLVFVLAGLEFFLFMDYLKHLSDDVITDMLVAYNTRYNELLTEKVKTQEFYQCKKMIGKLEEEINSRKKSEDSFRDLMMNN